MQEDRIFNELTRIREDFNTALMRMDERQDARSLRIDEHLSCLDIKVAESNSIGKSNETWLAKLNGKVVEHEKINGERAIFCALHAQTEQQILNRIAVVEIADDLHKRIDDLETQTQNTSSLVTFARGGYKALAMLTAGVTGLISIGYYLVRLIQGLASSTSHTP